MPIYEYRCRGCGADFERYVPGAAAALGVVCPSCAGGDVMRKLSVFGMKSTGEVMSAPSGGGCCGGGCACL